ncbi:hypothetical protein [Streptosporangium pseudovulgare]|nr:hypothetical protein [Streptosporangium pseudovulgare]
MSISPVCGYGAVGFIEYPSATCLHTGGGSFGQAGATGSFGTAVYSGTTGTATYPGTTAYPGTTGTAIYSGTTGTTGAAVIKGRSGAWRPSAITCREAAVPMASAATVCCVTVAIAPC